MPVMEWRRSVCARIVAVGFAACGVTACSTVESIDVGKAEEKERAGAYINYAVAKSLFAIQVSAASSGAASTSQSKSTPPTTPAQPTTWTISGTLSSGDKPAPDPKKDSTPADATECGVLNAQYGAAQTAVASEIKTYTDLTSRLAQMAAGTPAKDDTPKTLAEALSTYVTAVGASSYQNLVNRASGVYEQIKQKCPPKVSVNIQQTIVPDTSRTFALKARTNIFYADALSLSTDANGFLTNGAPSSTSQVTAIASAAASDLGLFQPVGNVQLPPAIRKDLAERPCEGTGVAKEICELGRSNAESAKIFAVQILDDLPKPGSLQNLPGALLPLTFYASLDEFEAGPDGKLDAPDSIKKVVMDFGLDLTLECSNRTLSGPQPTAENDSGPENREDPKDYRHPTASGVYDGLVVSASRSCRFEAQQDRDQTKRLVGQTYLWAQDSRYLTLLPTRRGFLVARSATYTFANGQATGVTDSRPSEALAIVSFPGAVVGSFFSGLTSAFTNSNASMNGQTSRITAQTNYLTAQTNYLTAKANLKKSEAPPGQ